jgi:ADP-ribosylglycohydrolase
MRHGAFHQEINLYKGYLKRDIEAWFGYDLDRTLDEIRPTYCFNESCQETVPEAIIAFLESTSFEDAIRNAISLGGDSDTLAAITGSIAEAAYGVPEDIKDTAMNYLDTHYEKPERGIQKQIADIKDCCSLMGVYSLFFYLRTRSALMSCAAYIA